MSCAELPIVIQFIYVTVICNGDFSEDRLSAYPHTKVSFTLLIGSPDYDQVLLEPAVGPGTGGRPSSEPECL